MYVLAGHSFAPWLIVQQNVVHPSQQAPPPHWGQFTSSCADTGRVRNFTGATAIAEPTTATLVRNPRRDVFRASALDAARASRWVTGAAPGGRSAGDLEPAVRARRAPAGRSSTPSGPPPPQRPAAPPRRPGRSRAGSPPWAMPRRRRPVTGRATGPPWRRRRRRPGRGPRAERSAARRR